MKDGHREAHPRRKCSDREKKDEGRRQTQRGGGPQEKENRRSGRREGWLKEKENRRSGRREGWLKEKRRGGKKSGMAEGKGEEKG